MLRQSGNEEQAQSLLDATSQWYRQTQPEGVYGYVFGTLEAHLLALSGQDDRAIDVLEKAINGGYRWQWKWDLTNPNYDAIRDRPEFKALIAYVEQDMAFQRKNLLAQPQHGEFDLRDHPHE